MKSIRRILTALSAMAVLVSFTVGLAAPQPVLAVTAQQEACLAVGNDANCNDTTTGKSGGDLTSTIKLIVNIVSILVGVVAVIMIIWGGLKYITSGGDTAKAKSAKDTIVYALIGLVVVALAQFIVKYVLATATKATK